jgi:glutamate carboxypeptidase
MNSLHPYQPYLTWIEEQRQRMIALIQRWAEINTGSHNHDGIRQMRQTLANVFGPHGDSMEEVELQNRTMLDLYGHLQSVPTPNGLCIKKRADAPYQIFLNGHMDTVYGPESPFQSCRMIEANRLNGPGVADLKGGLVILLIAIEALERSPFASKIGWQVFFNPDEEIGSSGSKTYLEQQAPHYDIGIVVEPQFPDGAFVHQRKGSATFVLAAHGKSAHAGRHFHQGINAIGALLEPLQQMHALNVPGSKTTLNIGMIRGGTATNIVPDLAIAHIDLRAATDEDLQTTRDEIFSIVQKGKQKGKLIELHQLTYRAPKPFDEPTKALFDQVAKTAKQLKIPMTLRESGGVCDGNTLAAMGLPVIDSMGVTGGHIHTKDEYIELDKLVERAQHLALVLMQISTGEFVLPTKD